MTSLPRPYKFLGLSLLESRYDEARVVILPVAYEGTVSYGTGTKNGPAAILAASREVETYDRETGRDLSTIGIVTHQELEAVATGPEAMIEAVHSAVAAQLDVGKRVVMLGGEHSITVGAVRAQGARHPGLTVLQIDAHADLRESYQGSRFSHACTMRRVHEHCRAVGVGIRNISEEGHQFARENNLPIFYAEQTVGRDDWYEMCFAALGEQVYITVDLDGLDPSIMPAVGTPEPGGFLYAELTAFLCNVFARCNVVGGDVVELAPMPGMRAPDFLAAKLVAFLCAGLDGWYARPS